VVPETLDIEALRAQPFVAHYVSRTVGMLRAVALDDQPMFERDEIDNESTKRDLEGMRGPRWSKARRQDHKTSSFIPPPAGDG
jgi:hypothetical protein